MINNKDNTLCWTCKKCYGKNQCDWANFSKPIKGWKTTEGDNEDETTRSVDVIFCPEYEKDDKAIEIKEVYNLLSLFFKISLTTAQTHWFQYATRYQKAMLQIYGNTQCIPQEKRIPEWFWYKGIDRKLDAEYLNDLNIEKETI